VSAGIVLILEGLAVVGAKEGYDFHGQFLCVRDIILGTIKNLPCHTEQNYPGDGRKYLQLPISVADIP